MSEYSCDLCQLEFDDIDAFNLHLRSSAAHEDCKRCRKGFQRRESYLQHVADATSHNPDRYTDVFVEDSRPRILLPIPVSPPPPSQDDLDRQTDRYEGENSLDVGRVWLTATANLSRDLSPEEIASIAGSELSKEIITLIMGATRRIVSPDWSEEGMQVRRASEKQIAAVSRAAETNFIDFLRAVWPDLIVEGQMQDLYREALTRGEDVFLLSPNILFAKPVQLFGKKCHWIEYKASFGFRSAPHVGAKHEKQYRKYAQHLGPGLVVYKHGFEKGLLEIDGVTIKREREVILHLLQRQGTTKILQDHHERKFLLFLSVVVVPLLLCIAVRLGQKII